MLSFLIHWRLTRFAGDPTESKGIPFKTKFRQMEVLSLKRDIAIFTISNKLGSYRPIFTIPNLYSDFLFEMEKSTISNLKSLASPPAAVIDVLIAFSLLLGYDIRISNVSDLLMSIIIISIRECFVWHCNALFIFFFFQNWRGCQKILADYSILSKVDNFDPLYCTLSKAHESEKILDKYSVEIIRNNDLNAAKVYTWVSLSLALCLCPSVSVSVSLSLSLSLRCS